MASDEEVLHHVQIKFVTKQEKYSVPDTPFSVPSNVEVQQLNELLNGLLEDPENKRVDFEFLINGEYLRVPLATYIEESSRSTEEVIEIEYFEADLPPSPQDSLPHEDWVSSVRGHIDGRILTASYDNTLRLWNTEGNIVATIPGHSAAVKCVSWIAGKKIRFISGSHDQTLLMWHWDQESNEVKCECVCKGHTGSVEAVAVDANGERFVSGSWDTMLKIWSAGPVSSNDADITEESEQHKRKKLRNDEKLKTRVPLMTLSGHKEALSACRWLDQNSFISASWDHTIRVWDVQAGQETRCLNGSKVFLDVDYSHNSGLILSASSDRHVRMWDYRTKEGAVVGCTYTSHTGWVTGVAWSPDNDQHFISGSYDMCLKMWDRRSPKVPLYNMTGHDDRILCVDWTIPDLLMSGGADSALKIFRR